MFHKYYNCIQFLIILIIILLVYHLNRSSNRIEGFDPPEIQVAKDSNKLPTQLHNVQKSNIV